MEYSVGPVFSAIISGKGSPLWMNKMKKHLSQVRQLYFFYLLSKAVNHCWRKWSNNDQWSWVSERFNDNAEPSSAQRSKIFSCLFSLVEASLCLKIVLFKFSFPQQILYCRPLWIGNNSHYSVLSWHHFVKGISRRFISISRNLKCGQWEGSWDRQILVIFTQTRGVVTQEQVRERN